MFMKTWRQHLAAMLANHTTLVAGLVLGWTSPTMPQLQLTNNQESWVGSLALLGALLGAVPAGCLADRLGRKRFLLLLSLPYITGWMLIVFALYAGPTDVGVLYAGRLICGVALGATTVAVPLYANEIAEDKVRGALGVYLDMMLTLGILVVYSLGAILEPLWLSVTCLLVPATLACAFAFMPETPSHLLSVGKPMESEKALRWLRGTNADDMVIQLELARLRSMMEASGSSRHRSSSVANGGPTAPNGVLVTTTTSNGAVSVISVAGDKDGSVSGASDTPMRRFIDNVTFRTPTSKAVFIVMGLMIFMQLSGIDAVIFYLGEIFEDAGSTLSPLNASIVVGVVQVVANVASAILVDRVGRRVLLLLSESLMAASLAALALYFHLRDDQGIEVSVHYGWVPIVALSVFVWLFAFGIGSLPWFMMAELLPPEAQDWGSSAAICLNWSLGFLVTNVFGSMVRDMGGAATYGVFCTICVIGTLFMAFVVPETKGRSPAEIQRILSRPNTYCSVLHTGKNASKV